MSKRWTYRFVLLGATDEDLGCGITEEGGKMVCWGNGGRGQARPPALLR